MRSSCDLHNTWTQYIKQSLGNCIEHCIGYTRALLAMFRYWLSVFPILQTGYLLTCAYPAAPTSEPFKHSPECQKINATTCQNINCTLGLYCEMQEVVCCCAPCCPVPNCYDPCERTVCPINFCSKQPGKVCALRQLKQCFVPPCCPDPVCEVPIKCSQSDCDIRCRGTEKLVIPSKFVKCNSGCSCD